MKSVAMAFYNGAKYIDEQIRSILDNMEETDELIINAFLYINTFCTVTHLPTINDA